MNEPQDNQMPPPQAGPRGLATPPQAGPQGYGPRYHDGQDPIRVVTVIRPRRVMAHRPGHSRAVNTVATKISIVVAPAIRPRRATIRPGRIRITTGVGIRHLLRVAISGSVVRSSGLWRPPRCLRLPIGPRGRMPLITPVVWVAFQFSRRTFRSRGDHGRGLTFLLTNDSVQKNAISPWSSCGACSRAASRKSRNGSRTPRPRSRRKLNPASSHTVPTPGRRSRRRLFGFRCPCDHDHPSTFIHDPVGARTARALASTCVLAERSPLGSVRAGGGVAESRWGARVRVNPRAGSAIVRYTMARCTIAKPSCFGFSNRRRLFDGIESRPIAPLPICCGCSARWPVCSCCPPWRRRCGVG